MADYMGKQRNTNKTCIILDQVNMNMRSKSPKNDKPESQIIMCTGYKFDYCLACTYIYIRSDN